MTTITVSVCYPTTCPRQCPCETCPLRARTIQPLLPAPNYYYQPPDPYYTVSPYTIYSPYHYTSSDGTA